MLTPFKLTHNLVDIIIIVPGHTDSMDTIVSEHKYVWAQSFGHSRVGTIIYGHKRSGIVWLYLSLWIFDKFITYNYGRYPM